VAEPPALHSRWLRALYSVAEVLFATADGTPPPARLRWLVLDVQAMIDHIGGRGPFVFRLSLLLVSVVAPLLVFKPKPLRTLSYEDRVRALDRYERSPLGLTLFVLKAMLCIVWYEHPGSAREVGFDGRALLHRAPSGASR
jgi:hypothetical protein